MSHVRFRSKIASIFRGINGRSKRDIYRECVDKELYNKIALMVIEVSSVLPLNSSEKVFGMFPTVYCTDDDLVDNKKVLKYCYPQSSEWPDIYERDFNEKKLLVSILSDKKSDHPLELYSQRRRDFIFMSLNASDDFDLFGFGWDSKEISSYRGVLKSAKAEVYPNYKFALCYEGAAINGNIDEKIFECMRSDCVPVFLGAPNVELYIPKNSFIDRRDFSSPRDLIDYLRNMSSVEYYNYKSNIHKFLNGCRFNEFSASVLADRIVDGFERLQ